MKDYYGSKRACTVCIYSLRPFHSGIGPHFVPLDVRLTYNERFPQTVRANLSFSDGEHGKYVVLNASLQAKYLGSSARTEEGLLTWQFFHPSCSPSFCEELRVCSLLSYRCLSAEVFKHNAPQYPVSD